MSWTLLGPVKKQRFFFNAVASLRVALRGRPRHPALKHWGCGRRFAVALWGGGHPAHQRSRSSKHSTHMVIHTYTDKKKQMHGPSQGQERWEWRWGNVGEGLQEVAVIDEVGRRSRVRAFRFLLRGRLSLGPLAWQVIPRCCGVAGYP